MSAPRYTLPAIALHWLQAVVVLWLLWLGWTMTELPKGAERSAAYGLHKSLGLLALLLSVLRLAWRHGHPPPPAIAHGLQKRLASATHLALYALLLLAPLSGFLASSFTPYAIKFFGLELPRLVGPDATLNSLCKQAHLAFVWSMAGLLLLHFAGGMKSLFLRDGTLLRMLPGQLFKN